MLREQLSELIQVARTSPSNTDTNTTENTENFLLKSKDENVENDEKTKLRSELTHITGLYERSASRVAALEEERSRLESEAKEMERDMARAIHSPANAVYRQVRIYFIFDLFSLILIYFSFSPFFIFFN